MCTRIFVHRDILYLHPKDTEPKFAEEFLQHENCANDTDYEENFYHHHNHDFFLTVVKVQTCVPVQSLRPQNDLL